MVEVKINRRSENLNTTMKSEMDERRRTRPYPSYQTLKKCNILRDVRRLYSRVQTRLVS